MWHIHLPRGRELGGSKQEDGRTRLTIRFDAVGGSDIDSVVSLRGFENYRFRAPNAMFVQAEYGYPVWGPLGSLVFYDAGNVGQTISDLSLARLRQDAGIGVTLNFGGNVVAEGYLAMGAGHGAHFGYNFTKFF